MEEPRAATSILANQCNIAPIAGPLSPCCLCRDDVQGPSSDLTRGASTCTGDAPTRRRSGFPAPSTSWGLSLFRSRQEAMPTHTPCLDVPHTLFSRATLNRCRHSRCTAAVVKSVPARVDMMGDGEG